MSIVSRNCRIRLQRLRGLVDDTAMSLESWGPAPGEICHLLPSCCSNPRRHLHDAVRLCECEPCVNAGAKNIGISSLREIPAKIAAFSVLALSHLPRSSSSIRCNRLEAKTGAFPPFLSQLAMPP
jgi:hypothetical protein